VNSPRRPWWQQATALVSLSAGGAVTGFAFVPGTADHVASPTSIPVTLTALEQSARAAASDDSAARSAIVSVANYYLRTAQSKTPAEMEALIWQRDSKDGADHGESCAAFASMTLALAAQLVGRHSWVTGGSTYPWPLQDWADVRVDPNPASSGIISILRDAQAHQRWHPLGDGYQPLPGDWVLFDGHVEVVTSYSGGVLSTVGGDSLPNFSVNGHQYPAPLAAQGVAGFVSNGNLPAASGSATASSVAPASPGTAMPESARTAPSPAESNSGAAATQQAAEQPAGALAGVPGTVAVTSDAPASMLADGAVIPGIPRAPAVASGGGRSSHLATPHQAAAPRAAARQATASQRRASQAASPQAAAPQAATSHISAEAAIPGMPAAAATDGPVLPSATADGRVQRPAASTGHQSASLAAPVAASGPGTTAQQAFIDQVAPGAIAAQRTYGVPAAVTIAQAIQESGWGQSTLAVQDHNLFGIKGAGPAGSDSYPTQEFQNGQWVTTTGQFCAYHDIAQSIEDHGKLLATSDYYTAAMAVRRTPDNFARALTGVYATDPNYGTNLIDLMQRFNLYRFGKSTRPAAPASASAGTATAQATASARPSATPSAPRPRAAAPRAARGGPAVSLKPATPSTTAAAPAVAPSTAVKPAAATPPPTATAPAHASPTGTASPRPALTPSIAVRPSAAASPTGTASPRPALTPSIAVRPSAAASPTWTGSPRPALTPSVSVSSPRATAASAAASTRGAAAAPSRPVPHPFATPQPQPPGPASPGTPPDQAAIPGIPSGPGTTSAHTSAQVRSGAGSGRLRSPSDTQVVAELAADYRHDPPLGKPAAAKVPHSRSPGGEPAAEASPAKRATADRSPAQKKPAKRKGAAAKARRPAPRYQPQMPPPVKNAFLASAKKPLARAELIYRDVAGICGISWKVLAACDWMQCEAHPRYSPVQGEKLGTVNADGTVFRTKSEALTQCARDLVTVADTVYQIDLTVPVELSVLELARVFAAFRWGGLLRLHDTSAMEFPYSVQGLTEQHASMRWPKIADPNAPDKPGARFRRPFGAVPVVLSLDYPATV
jgi:flagellum-specific peptidoglycan hydrolase FlgJ